MKRKLDHILNRSPATSAAGVGLVACPVCHKQVPSVNINAHLDTTCALNSIEGIAREEQQEARDQAARQDLTAPKTSKYFSGTDVQIGQSISQKALHQARHRNRTRDIVDRDAIKEECQSPPDSRTPGTGAQSTLTASRHQLSAQTPQGRQPDRPSELHAASPQVQQPAALAGRPLALLMQSAAKKKLPGQFLIKDFISEDEEQELIAFIDDCEPPWHLSTFNGPHKGKAWGVQMDLQKRTVSEPKYPMPAVLTDLAARMRIRQPSLASFFPSEANANDYYPERGMFLGPHVDDRQLSTGAIVTLSLVSSAVMSFQRDRQPKSPKIRVLLPQRSLQVLTQESRYSFTHAIDRQDFHGPRRLSITFRQSPIRY